MSAKMNNLYGILGAACDVTPEEIKLAYKARAHEWKS